MKGYIKALGETKLPFQPEFVFSYDTESKPDLSTNLKRFLNEKRNTLTAIVCYNDEVGFVVANLCRQLDISISEEISIICQNKYYFAKSANSKSRKLTK